MVTLALDTQLASQLTCSSAPRFSEVQSKIKAILQDKILVGHAVFNDLAVSAPAIGPGVLTPDLNIVYRAQTSIRGCSGYSTLLPITGTTESHQRRGISESQEALQRGSGSGSPGGCPLPSELFPIVRVLVFSPELPTHVCIRWKMLELPWHCFFP